ncbi:hypothetical protein OFN53_41155, partial [Escherichia coli]|nr:hypothetical protein [Escherichia coli]
EYFRSVGTLEKGQCQNGGTESVQTNHGAKHEVEQIDLHQQRRVTYYLDISGANNIADFRIAKP